MSIPSSIDALIEQLNQELEQIEQEATIGLELTRKFLEQFPENTRLILIFSSFSNAILFVEIEKRKIRSVLKNLDSVDVIPAQDIQEAGENLASELGRMLETKMMVNYLKTRLENLQ